MSTEAGDDQVDQFKFKIVADYISSWCDGNGLTNRLLRIFGI